MSLPPVRSVSLRTGVTLPYVEAGDPSGLPVLLLHGFTDSWRSFQLLLDRLPGSLRAIALTQRGHGGASRPGGGYRTRDFAADAVAFADALGLERVVVVGHSMGSANAMRFALDHPERTLGLLLVGAFASFRGNGAVLDFYENAILQLEDPVPVAFARAFQESTVCRPVPAPFLDRMVEGSARVPARVWRAATEGMLEDDVLAELDGIRAPTSIVFGERDAFCTRDDQELLRSSIANSSLLVYEETGHAPHWEQPARFASDLEGFVRRLAKRN